MDKTGLAISELRYPDRNIIAMSATVNGHNRKLRKGTEEPRQPPLSREIEQSLIGAIVDCVDGKSVLEEIGSELAAVDFSNPDFGKVFGWVRSIQGEGRPVTATAIVDFGRLSWDGDDDSLRECLGECIRYAASRSALKDYTSQIIDKANQRRALYATTQLVDDIYRGRSSTDHILTTVSSIVQELKSAVPKNEFPTLTSKELFEGEFRLDYLIPGILPKGQPCILAGPKKCLKTNILIDLTLSLASGCKFLGEFLVSGSVRVGLISGESGQPTIQETAIRIAKSKSWINLPDYSNAIWCFDLPKLGQPSSVKTLVKFIETNRLEVAILDPAYLMMAGIGDAASNLFLVGRMLGELTEAAQQTGCTIILCHHARKGSLNQYDPPELESISWAGFQEWARAWILLGRRAAYNPDSGGHHELWLASGGSAGHSGLWAVDITEGTRQDSGGRKWIVEVAKPYEARQAEQERHQNQQDQLEQVQRDRNRKKLLDVYRLFPSGETANKLKDAAGLSGTKFGPVNSDLMRLGLVETCTIIKANKSHDGYRLTPAGLSRTESDKAGSPTGEGVGQKPPLRSKGLCLSDSPPRTGDDDDSDSDSDLSDWSELETEF